MSEETSPATVGGKLFPPDKVREIHKNAIVSMGLPQWLDSLKCQNCGEPLGPLSIRGIGIRMNAASIGDLVLEVLCQSCGGGYDTFFRKACPDLKSFIRKLEGENPGSNPVSQMEMKSIDNNLFELMARERGEAPAGGE